MNTLTIKDLSVTNELDAHAMTSVRGGTSYKGGYSFLPSYSESKHDFAFSAEQLTSQKQDNVNLNGNNVAFANDIHSTFKPTQTSSNSISF